ncbi:hypothetical protein JW905_02890 [bacterium]|nr:hypothetical protein [candidate division CSSED10-310 bacterium]
MIVRYGTIPIRHGCLDTGSLRELEDIERSRIARLADRCRRRLHRVLERRNRRRDSSCHLILETGFETLFDDGFRGEVANRGGLSAMLDLEEIECNFDFAQYQMAYVWRLSRLVPDLYWHYNFVRFFKNGILFTKVRGRLVEQPQWRLPDHLARFVASSGRRSAGSVGR